METEAKTTVIATRPVTNGQMAQSATSPAPLAMPPQESYIAGFEGMATAPFPKEALEILREPVNPEDVEIKPDGICYLPGIFYRDRLMRAFGPGGWACGPRSPAKRAPAAGGECVMYHGALVCLGRFVSEAVGQCVYYPQNRGMTYADAFEGAKTDCITRCCKDLGIAKELWDPTWRTQWQAKYAHKVKKTVRGETVEVWERKSRAQKLQATPPTTAPTTAAAPSALGSAGDDGEAPDEAALNQLEDLVFTKLQWKKKFAGDWLKARFGTNDPGALTRMQVLTAHVLLHAFMVGAEKYAEILGQEVAAGRCKP